MQVTLELNKTVDENAASFYEKAKKGKKKLKGAMETVEKTEKKLKRLAKEEPVIEEKVERKKEWYEKFRWFKTSKGLFVLGGRDATTNEIVIKKHVDKDDLIFHTEMAGSPFFVLKGGADEESIREVADATATFSKAWKLNIQEQKVFYVNPDQVTKEAKSGEYVSKGAFMIYGKKNYSENKVNFSIGIKDGQLMGGPTKSVEAHCEKSIKLDRYREYKNESYDEVINKIVYVISNVENNPKLSEETIKAINAARKRLEKGKFITEEEAKRRLGINL